MNGICDCAGCKKPADPDWRQGSNEFCSPQCRLKWGQQLETRERIVQREAKRAGKHH